MNPSPISKKDIVKIIIFATLIISLILIFQINDKQTKIVFCDVGQGDATYMRIKNQVDVLIDAGPNKKVLNCLGRYMPFWDRKIEVALLTHHDSDHWGGYKDIVNRYQIDQFITINHQFDTKTYQQFTNEINRKKIIYRFVKKNDRILILKDQFIVYWPPDEYKSSDSNDYSLIFVFVENDFKVLFTGDASPLVFYRLLNQSKNNLAHLKRINILKVPHHGSKNGLIKEFLQLADPQVAVISVGKNNPYGHPHQQILEMLKAQKVQIRRTDIEGNIVFKLKTQNSKVKSKSSNF
jgi:competence protein ComEC